MVAMESLLFLVGLGGGALLSGGIAFLVRRNRRRRVEQVEAAAVPAAGDDLWFAPDEVKRAAGDLYLGVHEALRRGDREGLRALVGDKLLTELARRLGKVDREGTGVETPGVSYVGLVNRADDAADRVVVLLSGIPVEAYWTLARRDDRWIVVSIEAERAAVRDELDAPIVAVPGPNDAEEQRLAAERDAEPAGWWNVRWRW